jgi:hypothetical protein
MSAPVTGTKPEATYCVAAPLPLSLKDKLRHRLFPTRWCSIPDPEPTWKDVITCKIGVCLSWPDMLRLLFSRRLIAECHIATENEVGQTKTATTAYVLPPQLLDSARFTSNIVHQK